MKTEFRNRAFLPIVMPLAILLVIGLVVGVVASILLFVDRQGAVAVAMLGAAGILVAISLAASQDRLDARRRSVVVLAGIAPLAVGALAAAGVVGGLTDEERNINVEPHAPQFVFEGIEEGAPVLAAETAAGFCLPEECGSSTTNEWAFSYEEAGEVMYAFDNRDTTATHNLMIYDVDDQDLSTLDGPISLSQLQDNYEVITPAEPPTFMGPQAQTYRWTPEPAEGEEGQAIPPQAYFVCTIHSGSMWGVVDITAE